MSKAIITETENKCLNKVVKRITKHAKKLNIYKSSDSAHVLLNKLIAKQASSIDSVLAASKDCVVMPMGVFVKISDESEVSFSSFTLKPMFTYFDEKTVTFIVVNDENGVVSTTEFTCNLIGKTPIDLLSQSSDYVKQLTDRLAEIEVVELDYQWAIYRLHEYLLSALFNGQLRTLSAPSIVFKFEDNELRFDQIEQEESVPA